MIGSSLSSGMNTIGDGAIAGAGMIGSGFGMLGDGLGAGIKGISRLFISPTVKEALSENYADFINAYNANDVGGAVKILDKSGVS